VRRTCWRSGTRSARGFLRRSGSRPPRRDRRLGRCTGARRRRPRRLHRSAHIRRHPRRTGDSISTAYCRRYRRSEPPPTRRRLQHPARHRRPQRRRARRQGADLRRCRTWRRTPGRWPTRGHGPGSGSFKETASSDSCQCAQLPPRGGPRSGLFPRRTRSRSSPWPRRTHRSAFPFACATDGCSSRVPRSRSMIRRGHPAARHAVGGRLPVRVCFCSLAAPASEPATAEKQGFLAGLFFKRRSRRQCRHPEFPSKSSMR